MYSRADLGLSHWLALASHKHKVSRGLKKHLHGGVCPLAALEIFSYQASMLEDDGHGLVSPLLHLTASPQKQSFLADHGPWVRNGNQSVKKTPLSRSPLGVPGAQFYQGLLGDSEDLVPQS